MATAVVLCVLLTIASILTEIAATTVEVSVPVHPITVGGILPIQCQIWGMEEAHTVKMFRVINGKTEELTSELRYFSSSLDQRVFITKRTIQGGIKVYFMTIVDTTMLDQAEYLCKVFALSRGNYDTVAEGSVDVEIYFLPDSIYPMCESTPALTANMNEGVELTLRCISAKGAPAVALRWVDNRNQKISSRPQTLDDTVSSEISSMTSLNTHNTVFICKMTSPGFTDFIRTCKIGPITIKKSTPVTIPEIRKPIFPTQITEHKTFMSDDCSNECSEANKYTILYLSVATVGAALLCIVFLITTIVMCIKYHNISGEVRETRMRNIATTDGSEPVYVSLQARPELVVPERRSLYREPDRSSTYMSVEDPNNPGNKVLMPKEVFEEFYNSLNLKKTHVGTCDM